MSGSLLTNLPAASALDGTEALYVVQSGADKKATGAQVKAFVGLGTITGTFSADGSISVQLPAGAVLVGGKIVPANSNGATVSLGSSSGASDVLAAIAIPGTPDAGQPIQGLNFLKSIFASNQTIFVHSASWGSASVTVTLWYFA